MNGNMCYNNDEDMIKRKTKSHQEAEETFLKDKFRRKIPQATLMSFCSL